MKDPEIHPAVDADKVQAQRNAEAWREEAQRIIEDIKTKTEAVKRRRCRRATLALVTRVVVAIALSFLVCIGKKHGLVAWEVSALAILVLSSWLCLWAGAWLQFMWGKEGLLR